MYVFIPYIYFYYLFGINQINIVINLYIFIYIIDLSIYFYTI
mgnify:CR=1 FL=1|jgi:hypothetical protein